MKAISTLVLALLLTPFSVLHSQDDHFSCGLTEKLHHLYQEYPELEQEQEEFLARCRTSPSSLGDRDDIYVVPVVFHVIHENGVENISDSQIYDQMDILNLDFRMLNPDASDIVPEFVDIAADSKIEFRLANKDPMGNCTNGIEHIYSHETHNGDDFSKLNQWPRSRYLNVWVVASMSPGVAGYAYYPSAVSTGLYYADGIIIRHEYIGSIGTSSPFNARALTHEIGHWLGLPHTWGSTNSPGVSCGDDGIADTPVTEGHTSCELVGNDNCNPGIIENVQNFMEYSYCSRMYTEDQAEVMNNTLSNSVSSRNHLVSDQNHGDTGIDGPVELCSPLPDFFVDDEVICAGAGTQYFASVSRAEVDSYSWSFPGGSPSTSTEMNPTVTYEEDGLFACTLTVTNSAGTETIIKENFIRVTANYWFHVGPHSEDFESINITPTEDWIILNPEDNDTKWEITDKASYSGDKSIGVFHYKSDPHPILEPHYYDRLGGLSDVIITPSYNLSSTSDAALTFRFAHATMSSGLFDDSQLELKVSYRANCDANWSTLGTVNGLDLLTAGYQGGPFLPGPTDDLWKMESFSLPNGALKANVRFRFEFVAGDHANNFFLDDINVSGVLGLSESSNPNFHLYPNPSNDVFYISGESGNASSYQIYAPSGQLIKEGTLDAYQKVQVSELAVGLYYVLIDGVEIHKFVKR